MKYFSALRWLAMAVLLLSVPSLRGQVTIDAAIDSFEIFIGKQANLTIEVSCSADDRPEMPVYKSGDMVIPGVEVVDVARPDTQMLNDGKRMQIMQRYVITSFDSAFYYLPPFVVKVDDKEYTSASLALNVISPEVDTLNYKEYFQADAEVEDVAYMWDEFSDIVYSFSLACLVVALLVYLYIRYKQNRPIIRIIRLAPKVPPHQQAMVEIERIKSDKKWAQEDSKEYYTELTETLRTYIQERYGFSAMEMTSEEIIERLLQSSDPQPMEELKELFRTADLVKFAKYSTLINENDRNLVSAIDFINQTKQEEVLPAQPEKKVVVEDHRDPTSVTIHITAMVICGVIVTGLLIYAGWMVYENFVVFD